MNATVAADVAQTPTNTDTRIFSIEVLTFTPLTVDRLADIADMESGPEEITCDCCGKPRIIEPMIVDPLDRDDVTGETLDYFADAVTVADIAEQGFAQWDGTVEGLADLVQAANAERLGTSPQALWKVGVWLKVGDTYPVEAHRYSQPIVAEWQAHQDAKYAERRDLVAA
jgi:hypothetical protein